MIGGIIVGGIIGAAVKTIYDGIKSDREDNGSYTDHDSSDWDERPSGYPGISIRRGGYEDPDFD